MANRVFDLVDVNRDGIVTDEEYNETIKRITDKKNLDEAIKFLFQIYDTDGTCTIMDFQYINGCSKLKIITHYNFLHVC